MAPPRKRGPGRASESVNVGSVNDTPEDDDIVQEAQDHLQEWTDWESDFQTLYRNDTKFANGDSDNGWQWPDDIYNQRTSGQNKRPALTINKVATKVALIVNDARQNKPSVSIKPVGDETTFEAAQVWEGVVRHIEYISNAQAIYDETVQSQVEGGIGYMIVNTKFCDDDTFNQDIIIEPVQNQMGVALDTNIKQVDGSDAKWGIIFEDIPQEEAEIAHPEVNFGSQAELLGGPRTWIKAGNVRLAQYYRLKETKDELIYMVDENGEASTFFKSEVPERFRKKMKEAEETSTDLKKRTVLRHQLEWYKIVGNQIIDRNLKLPGPYIPIVRVVGIERIIDGKLHRRGHVRTLKDPQRMYNYNSSGQVEAGALGTKTKWVGQKEAFEGNETAWNNANIQNAAYLTVNGWDAEHDREIPMPVEMSPTQSVPVFLDGMKIAEHEIDMASGQYEAQDGRQGNERSGVAIAERQRQGDTSTYHFNDHLALGIRYLGRIILAWGPKIYDTERVLQIRGKDGTQSKVNIKPDATVAFEKKKEEDAISIAFNPKIGKYLVEADIGPAYSTQRQEAWNAFVQIVTGAPNLIDEIGDLMFRSADFPLADKIAERLQRKIKAEKPFLFDDEAPTPQVQAMQQELKQLTDQVGTLLQQLAENRLKLIGKDQRRDVDAYRAFTDRVKGLSNAQPELQNMPQMMQQLISALSATFAQMGGQDPTDTLQNIDNEPLQGEFGEPQNMMGEEAPQDMNAPEEEHPVPGAKKSPKDGKWYVQHPETGQYMLVEPHQQ